MANIIDAWPRGGADGRNPISKIAGAELGTTTPAHEVQHDPIYIPVGAKP
jgi:hypothetical protein